MHFLWATHTIGGCIWAITLLRRVQRGHYLWRYFKFVWMESCEAKNSQKLKKVLCSLCCAPSPCSCWPGLLISVRMMLLTMTSQMILMIIRFTLMSIRWHLRAEAKKRLSVDTELAAPFLTQVGTPFLKLSKELCRHFFELLYFFWKITP